MPRKPNSTSSRGWKVAFEKIKDNMRKKYNKRWKPHEHDLMKGWKMQNNPPRYCRQKYCATVPPPQITQKCKFCKHVDKSYVAPRFEMPALPHEKDDKGRDMRVRDDYGYLIRDKDGQYLVYG